MDTVLDFFVRTGDITVGVLAALLILVIILAGIIEVIDFLIVDPINRKRSSEDETVNTEEND